VPWQVAAFISTALGVPGAYPFSRPQLAEFFVHHHFLHFTQQYQRLPSCPSAAAARCCLCHMQASRARGVGVAGGLPALS
jgi:hypothetical protein